MQKHSWLQWYFVKVKNSPHGSLINMSSPSISQGSDLPILLTALTLNLYLCLCSKGSIFIWKLRVAMEVDLKTKYKLQPSYLRAQLLQLETNHLLKFGLMLLCSICVNRENIININNNKTFSNLVMSVPPSSAGGVQLTTTLSWNTSVTLQVSGGVGLSVYKI